jgi:hypothetical protein
MRLNTWEWVYCSGTCGREKVALLLNQAPLHQYVRDSAGTASWILKLGARWRGAVSSVIQTLYSWRKKSDNHGFAHIYQAILSYLDHKNKVQDVTQQFNPEIIVLYTNQSKTDLHFPWDYAIRRFHSQIISRVQLRHLKCSCFLSFRWMRATLTDQLFAIFTGLSHKRVGAFVFNPKETTALRNVGFTQRHSVTCQKTWIFSTSGVRGGLVYGFSLSHACPQRLNSKTPRYPSIAPLAQPGAKNRNSITSRNINFRTATLGEAKRGKILNANPSATRTIYTIKV